MDHQFGDGLREIVLPQAVLQWLQFELAESDRSERAAQAQEMLRQKKEPDVSRRLNLLYEDGLNGRIDAATYEQTALQKQDRIWQ